MAGLVPAVLAPGGQAGQAVQAELERLELLQQVLWGGAQVQAGHSLSGNKSAQVSGNIFHTFRGNEIFFPSRFKPSHKRHKFSWQNWEIF